MGNKENQVQLFGRVFVSMKIEVSDWFAYWWIAASDMEIGGVDNPVIRNPLNKQPYIPGSSLRGKMRSQLEKSLGSESRIII